MLSNTKNRFDFNVGTKRTNRECVICASNNSPTVATIDSRPSARYLGENTHISPLLAVRS